MSLRLIELFAKTKILVTLGPATDDTDTIKKLIHSGIDGVRLNFSHGNYEYFDGLFKEIEKATIEEKIPLAVLIDLQGPKIRIGELSENQIELYSGDKIEITTEDVLGTKELVSTSYKKLADDAQIGDPILINDGLIRLRVVEKRKNSVVCYTEIGGILLSKKGMNLPGMKLSTESVTEKDFNYLEFALKYRFDYIALSFVRSSSDILIIKQWLKNKGIEKPVIAKIEKKEAIDNFEEILAAADGIMVARGDLGVELPPQDVPVIQKDIIRKCNSSGKLVITATQMLESMISNPIPTRAEANDVANAVWDGTDVVMLSGETSIGSYPLKAVQIMNDIVRKAEQHLPACSINYVTPQKIEENLFDSVGNAISIISRQINASAIIVFTYQGRTAVNLSKYRPAARILAMTNSFETMNYLTLKWGVATVFLDEIDKEHLAIDKAKKLSIESGHIKTGDVVLFVAGAPYSDKCRVSWMRIEVI